MPRVLRNQKTGGSGKRACFRKEKARSFPKGKQKPESEASRVFSESWIPRREKVGRFVGARGFFIPCFLYPAFLSALCASPMRNKLHQSTYSTTPALALRRKADGAFPSTVKHKAPETRKTVEVSTTTSGIP